MGRFCGEFRPPPDYAASTLSVATQNVINEEQGHDGCRAR